MHVPGSQLSNRHSSHSTWVVAQSSAPPLPPPEDFPFDAHACRIVSGLSERLFRPTTYCGMVRETARRRHRPQLVLQTLPAKHHTPLLEPPVACQHGKKDLQQAQRVNT